MFLKQALQDIDPSKLHETYSARISSILEGGITKEDTQELFARYPFVAKLQELVLLEFMSNGVEKEIISYANTALGCAFGALLELAEVEDLGYRVPGAIDS